MKHKGLVREVGLDWEVLGFHVCDKLYRKQLEYDIDVRNLLCVHRTCASVRRRKSEVLDHIIQRKQKGIRWDAEGGRKKT